MGERTIRPRVSDSKWATQPTDKAAAAVARARARQELASALHEFIKDSGGFIVSAPGSDLRIEVVQGSPLPAKLAALGYAVHHCGTGQRIMPGGRIEVVVERGRPVTRRNTAILPVDIIEIVLPGA